MGNYKKADNCKITLLTVQYRMQLVNRVIPSKNLITINHLIRMKTSVLSFDVKNKGIVIKLSVVLTLRFSLVKRIHCSNERTDQNYLLRVQNLYWEVIFPLFSERKSSKK